MALNSKGESANPLDKFQSYSYQHILMVTDTTEGLYKIQEADKDGDFKTASFENISLTTPMKGTDINNGSGVYIVCDSRQNSNFSIKSVEYSSDLGSGGNPDQTQILLGTLKMQIFDSNGMAFMNYLQYLMDTVLKCDAYDFMWALKTIFVGHTPEGNTEVITSSFISLKVITISVSFDMTGGTYDIIFGATSSGAPLLNSNSSITGHSSTNIKSDANRTLLSVFQNFQNQLNKELKDYYDKLRVVQLPPTGNPDSSEIKTNAVAAQGKLVQYMFTIPEEWNSWTVDGGAAGHQEVDWKAKKTAQSTDTKQQQQDNKQKPNTAVGAISINIDPETQITKAINLILGRCDQLLKQAGSDKRTEGKNVKIHKTLAGITSDDKMLCLHWDIIEYTIPLVVKDKNAKANVMGPEWDSSADGQALRPKNSLEFDYYFSGKNNDITHFDMKMANAVNLLLNTTMEHDVSGKILHNQKNDAKAKDTPTKENVSFIRQNTPIYMPTKTADQKTAYAYIAPGSSQSARVKEEYTATLSGWYAQSNINVKMRIRGNPNLMVRAIQTIAPHVSDISTDGKTGSQMKAYRAHLNEHVVNEQKFESTGLSKNLASWPLWIKVNIFAPNVNFDGKQIKNDKGISDFATKFWFDEYYRAQTIVHTFGSDGTFSQEITMSAVPVNRANAERDAETKAKAIKDAKK